VSGWTRKTQQLTRISDGSRIRVLEKNPEGFFARRAFRFQIVRSRCYNVSRVLPSIYLLKFSVENYASKFRWKFG